jgi:hypothetical protein
VYAPIEYNITATPDIVITMLGHKVDIVSAHTLSGENSSWIASSSSASAWWLRRTKGGAHWCLKPCSMKINESTRFFYLWIAHHARQKTWTHLVKTWYTTGRGVRYMKDEFMAPSPINQTIVPNEDPRCAKVHRPVRRLGSRPSLHWTARPYTINYWIQIHWSWYYRRWWEVAKHKIHPL